MKRAFDLVLSLVLFALLALPCLLVALLVKLDSRGPILFHAPRVGRHGRIFLLHKFRTMSAGVAGPAIAIAADSRVTRIGRLLRHTRIDEIPQIWNVLVGEMSLVGPRPEDPRFVDPDDAAWRRVLSVRPGVTGPTQLEFADRERDLLGADHPERDYRERVLPAKLRLDAAYAEGRTFRGDLLVLLRTAARVAGARL